MACGETGALCPVRGNVNGAVLARAWRLLKMQTENCHRFHQLPGGSDHELLIAKFRLKLKKIGKTIRSFRYGLNQIPYDYTVEMTNRFNKIDLIERLKNYGQRFITVYRR